MVNEGSNEDRADFEYHDEGPLVSSNVGADSLAKRALNAIWIIVFDILHFYIFATGRITSHYYNIKTPQPIRLWLLSLDDQVNWAILKNQDKRWWNQ